MQRRTFKAMGTEVEVLLDRTPDARSRRALTAVKDEFERIEASISRFRPESELSELNRTGSLRASETLREVTALALDARKRTDGRFDPTVYDALVGAGYDRTFEQVAGDTDDCTRPASCGGMVHIEGDTITLGPGTHLDFGGIGKGYAVDHALDLLEELGPALVSAGGDLAVSEGVWPVGVETSEGVLTLELERGAVATSGRDRRRWRRAGVEQHHLIDPATGKPAESDLLAATVFAPSAVEAEVLAKVAFLAGEAEAPSCGAAGVLVTADGRTVLMGALG